MDWQCPECGFRTSRKRACPSCAIELVKTPAEEASGPSRESATVRPAEAAPSPRLARPTTPEPRTVERIPERPAPIPIRPTERRPPELSPTPRRVEPPPRPAEPVRRTEPSWPVRPPEPPTRGLRVPLVLWCVALCAVLVFVGMRILSPTSTPALPSPPKPPVAAPRVEPAAIEPAPAPDSKAALEVPLAEDQAEANSGVESIRFDAPEEAPEPPSRAPETYSGKASETGSTATPILPERGAVRTGTPPKGPDSGIGQEPTLRAPSLEAALGASRRPSDLGPIRVALRELEKAGDELRAAPSDMAAAGRLVQAAAVARYEGRGAESFALSERAAAAAPSSASVQIFYGSGLLAAGRATDAEERFLRAVLLEPRRAESWQELGRAWAATGNARDATAAFVLSELVSPAERRSVETLHSLARRAASDPEWQAIAEACRNLSYGKPPNRKR